MRRTAILLCGLLAVLGLGCAPHPQPLATQVEQWAGPGQAVSSQDATHCEKSSAAQAAGLPGFILIAAGDLVQSPGAFRSTEERAEPAVPPVDSGYRLRDLKLMMDPTNDQVVYVQKGTDRLLFVYRWGPCA